MKALQAALWLALTAMPAAAGQAYTIDQALQTALENNLEIRKAAVALDYAKNDWRYHRSERLPQVALTHGYDRSFTDSTGNDTLVSSSGLEISQELFRFGRDDATVSKKTALLAAEEHYVQTRRIEITSLRKTFIEYLLISDEITLRSELTDEFKTRYERMQGRLEAGKVKPIDVKEARLEYLDESLRVNTLKRDLRNKALELLDVMGLLPGTLPEDAAFTGSIESFMEQSLKEVGLCALSARADTARIELTTLEEEVRLQGKQVIHSYFQWLPAVSGTQFYYRNSQAKLAIDLDNTTSDLWKTVLSYTYPFAQVNSSEATEPLWGVSLNFNLPLFAGFKKLAKLNMEKAELENYRVDLAMERNGIRLEVANAWAAMLNLMEREQIEKERVQTTKERMLIIEELIELPLKSYITYEDVLRRREDFTGAQQSYFTVRKNYLFAIEDLKAAAGMYEDVP